MKAQQHSSELFARTDKGKFNEILNHLGSNNVIAPYFRNKAKDIGIHLLLLLLFYLQYTKEINPKPKGVKRKGKSLHRKRAPMVQNKK